MGVSSKRHVPAAGPSFAVLRTLSRQLNFTRKIRRKKI